MSVEEAKYRDMIIMIKLLLLGKGKEMAKNFLEAEKKTIKELNIKTA